MSTSIALALLAIVFFIFVAGFVILWWKGPRDLAAWGKFVSTVLSGSRQSELGYRRHRRFWL